MSASSNRATCQATRRDGGRCTRLARPGTQYCTQHSSAMRRILRAITRNPAISFALAVVGILVPIVIIFVGPYLMALLPGPRVLAAISKFKAPDGCEGYMINLATSSNAEPVDRLDLTVQLPGDIADHMFGAGSEVQFSKLGKAHIDAFEIGKDAHGDCKVVQAAKVESADMTATVTGNGTIQLRGTNVLPSTSVAGMVVLKPPSFHPAELHEDGSYTYSKFGFAVTKAIEFRNTDIDLKSKEPTNAGSAVNNGTQH
jgi:hypothetical protein